MDISPHSVILFQGDSITDAGRDPTFTGPNAIPGLGNGYASRVAEHLTAGQEQNRLQIYNRGVSGNRINDLHRRWERDTLRLLPDLLSILIGINDLWDAIRSPGSHPQQAFESSYRDLLQWTRDERPYTTLVLCEPFALQVGMVDEDWAGPLAEMQHGVKKLAEEIDALHVPLQSTLDAAAARATPGDLTVDGVHPTQKGHHVLAQGWMDHVLDNGKE